MYHCCLTISLSHYHWLPHYLTITDCLTISLSLADSLRLALVVAVLVPAPRPKALLAWSLTVYATDQLGAAEVAEVVSMAADLMAAHCLTTTGCLTISLSLAAPLSNYHWLPHYLTITG